jgi:GAF domain-containing protein
MSIMVYDPPPCGADEVRRERAVEASGALRVRDDPVLANIAETTRKRFRAATAAISIVHGDYQYLIAASGMPTGLYSRRTSMCGHAVASKSRLFVVADVATDLRFAGNPWVNGEEGSIGFYAAALLCDEDGLALGTLCVTDARARPGLSEPDKTDLRLLSEQVVMRLEDLRP